MGWLIAHHATERRRADDRAGRLRAQRQRHHHISHGRCRATGGAAWRMRHIVRIGSFAGGEHGEFGGHRLAENDGPCGTQQRHAGCVPGRSVPRVYRRAIAGGHVRGVNKVLDANRHAMQGALCRAMITHPRLCQCCLGVEIFPGSNALFPRHDPFETGVTSASLVIVPAAIAWAASTPVSSCRGFIRISTLQQNCRIGSRTIRNASEPSELGGRWCGLSNQPCLFQLRPQGCGNRKFDHPDVVFNLCH